MLIRHSMSAFYDQIRLPVVLLLCLAANAGSATVDQAPIEGVRILPPESSPSDLPEHSPVPETTAVPLEPRLASGRLLLHRYGCTTCHALELPPSPVPPAPRLDAIAHKVSAAWLRRWLEDPFDHLPQSKMPRVELTPEEREQLIPFLLSLAPERLLPTWPDLKPDPYNGAMLFAELTCQQCHRLGGEGGIRGPSLDLLGNKISRSWLYAFLKAPGIAQPGTVSHSFHLVDQEAVDLCDFLIRRFTGDREIAQRHAPVAADSTLVRAGLQTAIRRGCFQCHTIGPLNGPRLSSPVGADTALAWLDRHSREGLTIPSFHIPPPARRAMQAALQADRRLWEEAATPGSLPADFWQLPLPPQGPAPEFYSTEVRDLSPQTCAFCHVDQEREWRQSRHARSLSPGLLSQLVDMDEEFIRHCLTCHAPAAQQFTASIEADAFAPGEGVTCVACHVRAHRYFGPPPHPMQLTAARSTGGQHGGAVASSSFTRSSFCAPCHQFDADGLALDGKLLQNTRAEWERSPQGRAGATCQSCHMPGGSHQIEGIHDPLTVGRALELEVVQQPVASDRLRGTVRLHNRGAGHHLPTYATPAILVKVALGDRYGGVIDSTLEIRVVQRRVDMVEGRELFDTRIPAGGSWEFTFIRSLPAQAHLLTVVVEVDPDYFYRSFFDELEGGDKRSAELIHQAHARILDSPYILFVRTLELADAPLNGDR